MSAAKSWNNSTRDAANLSDEELQSRIDYLKRASHLGAWALLELSKAQAEVTTRKLKRRGQS